MIRTACVFLGLGAAWHGLLAAPAKPNLLFIFTDDQSHRTVSCYEQSLPWADTPNIDRLAAEGVRFTAAYGSSWCAPSRAMALTGRMLHGIEGLDFSRYPDVSYDPSVFRMWPEDLRRHGYTTALIGKWHLGPEYGHGTVWDHSIVWNRLNTAIAGDYFRHQKLRFDGGDYTAVGGHSTENYTGYAESFIKRSHDKPWMLWLCYDAVHAPFTASDRHTNAYGEANPVPIPEDIYPPRMTKPRYMQQYAMLRPGPEGLPIDSRQNLPLPDLVRKYHAGVLDLDDAVGRLLGALEKSGQLEHTIIVYTSDQGLAMGHHGMTIKVAPYDDNLRVPFIVRLPDQTSRGAVIRHAVNVIDLVPTFYDYARLSVAWEMHGDSLRPLLESPAVPWDRAILQENFSKCFGSETDGGVTFVDREKGLPNQGVDWWIFLRDKKYKYIRTLVAGEMEELYDLETDPSELTNLALDPKYGELVVEMRESMVRELRAKQAGLVDNMPDVAL